MDESENSSRLTPGGYREVLKVAYPLVISMGSFTLMQFCDRIFLSWYSAVAIQAALPAGILSFTLICTFMALAGYANTFVAQYFGAKDYHGCSRATAQGVFLALLSWPLILALIPVGQWMLRFSGHAPEVLRDELAYFNILMLGGVTVPLGAAISSFFTGRGDTLTNMLASIAGNVTNVVLDYAMIFGHWGFPEMGIAGAAIATVISGFVAPAILFVLYFSPKLRERYAPGATFRWNGGLIWRMIRFGFPSAVHIVLDVGAFTLFVLITGRMGSQALSASNIALSINNLAFMPLLGISIAASTLVGQYQGKRESAHAETSTWTCLKVSWIYMAVVALSFVLFPRAYFSLFAGDATRSVSLEQILPLGRYLLIMLAAWGMMDAANLVLSGALKGAGDTRFVMYYSVIISWGIWIVGELVIVLLFKGGIIPVWLWMTFYVMIMSVGFYIRFRRGKWKSIELIEREAPLQPSIPGSEALAIVD